MKGKNNQMPTMKQSAVKTKLSRNQRIERSKYARQTAPLQHDPEAFPKPATCNPPSFVGKKQLRKIEARRAAK